MYTSILSLQSPHAPTDRRQYIITITAGLHNNNNNILCCAGSRHHHAAVCDLRASNEKPLNDDASLAYTIFSRVKNETRSVLKYIIYVHGHEKI